MAEPTASKYPTEYDDDSSLLGDLVNHRNFELAENLAVDGTNMKTVALVDDVKLPCYITFRSKDDVGTPDSEIIYAEEYRSDGYGFQNILRARLGSTATAKTAGASALIAVTSKHVEMLREAIVAAQKSGGLVGVDANKPASPVRDQIYIATDTKKVYACFTDGTWETINLWDHGELSDLGNDGHTQYHNNARALTWHSGLSGGHVIDGDDHTHQYGDGAGRFQSGLDASKGTPDWAGEIYLATDTKFLYVAPDTESWQKITGAPTGAIAMFKEADITTLYGGACPPGWSRYTDMDGRFPKGAPTGVTSPLNQGGATAHQHTYTDIVSHQHYVQAQTPVIETVGSHYHYFKYGSGSSQTGAVSLYVPKSSQHTSTAGAHTHTATRPAGATQSTGVNPATSGSSSSLPPYQEVIFCKKD